MPTREPRYFSISRVCEGMRVCHRVPRRTRKSHCVGAWHRLCIDRSLRPLRASSKDIPPTQRYSRGSQPGRGPNNPSQVGVKQRSRRRACSEGRLSTIGTPTLVIHGKEDPLVPVLCGFRPSWSLRHVFGHDALDQLRKESLQVDAVDFLAPDVDLGAAFCDCVCDLTGAVGRIHA